MGVGGVVVALCMLPETSAPIMPREEVGPGWESYVDETIRIVLVKLNIAKSLKKI